MADTKFEIDKQKLQVRITRIFNTTQERLWQAYADPEQVAVWWKNTTIDQHDFKVGGKWRYVDHGKSGDENHAFKGEFKEIDRPNKIVRTFEYEPWAGHVLVESVTLEGTPDGKTKMTAVSKYDNIDDLNGMVQSGMERGATAGLDRLAKLVEEN